MANSLEKRRYFFIYKTTNLANGKYYIGMHTTSNLKDGYLGSGTYLRRSIRKYGKENFKCEILEFYKNREELVKREKELVHEELIKDPLCMNLKPGGLGGLCSKEHHQLMMANSLKKKRLNWSNPEIAKERKLYLSEIQKEKWRGLNVVKKEEVIERLLKKRIKTHTKESKEKISRSKKETGKGETNSQFGTCWITNGIINKKIKKGAGFPEGWVLGRVNGNKK